MDTTGRLAQAGYADLVDALPIAAPFTIEHFVQQLSQRRGKHIELVPVRLRETGPCGLLVKTDEVDYICYPANTSTVHRWHILLHEIGHDVLGHPGRRVTLTPDDDDVLAVLQRYMPDLSPTLIRHLLSRTSYEAAEEQDAEQFAMLASRRLRHLINSSRRAEPPDEGRLRTIFAPLPQGDDRG